MAVRRLAQAAVEGGRSGWSKEARRRLARWHRRRLLDDDGEPSRRKAAPIRLREFADRLSVLWRWLESRIGRQWDEMYSEFCRENDRRSLKGWHLHAHLSYEVANAGFPRQSSNWRRYAVDANGTLRMLRERYCRQRNAVQEENYRARKRSRQRNGSRRK